VKILLWLLIPLAGVLIGAAWVKWRSRPRRTPDAVEGMAEMYRVRQAMNQPMPEALRRHNEVRVESHEHPQVQIDHGATSTGEDGRPSDAGFRKSA
jgi:hypothetical protein